jgi:hypothetical protein
MGLATALRLPDYPVGHRACRASACLGPTPGAPAKPLEVRPIQRAPDLNRTRDPVKDGPSWKLTRATAKRFILSE